MGNGSGLGNMYLCQGFNHGFPTEQKNSSQHTTSKIQQIGEDSHIGANSVYSGVTIGKRCQIGAGSGFFRYSTPFFR
jgi:acetyltransferase-like isoleucine patch superfamily enzyme